MVGHGGFPFLGGFLIRRTGIYWGIYWAPRYHIYIYTCRHVCMYVCMYVCIYIYAYRIVALGNSEHMTNYIFGFSVPCFSRNLESPRI